MINFANKVQSEFANAISFIKAIGINVMFENIDKETFLPGLCIVDGSIVIDKNKLKYPGDVLHEAGHLAVVPTNERATLNEHDIALRPQREAEEMMAIAWSYAACVHLGIGAEFVFHNDGYKGGGSSLVQNFENKQYFGVPMLQWVGMTLEEKNAIGEGKPFYPYMINWLRQ